MCVVLPVMLGLLYVVVLSLLLRLIVVCCVVDVCGFIDVCYVGIAVICVDADGVVVVRADADDGCSWC